MVFEKIYKCLFIPNCTRKIMWWHINNIHEKLRDSRSQLCRSKARASSAKIIYTNIWHCAFGQNNLNNKIQWCFHIFKAQKKVKSQAKQFEELFSLYPNHFRRNEIVVCEVWPCLFLISAYNHSRKVLRCVGS